ncbi:transposase [Bradyrhizobium diazoefficiens]
MIIPAQGLRIVLAVRPVDFRCGHDALAGLVQNTLGLDPHSGLIVVFRSKRADRLKILLWDGTGLVLVYKRLGRDGRFPVGRSKSPGYGHLKLPHLMIAVSAAEQQ